MAPRLKREELLPPGELIRAIVEKNGRASKPQSPVEDEELGVQEQTLTGLGPPVGHIERP